MSSIENDPPEFLHRLEEALTLRAAWLDTVHVPLLKDLAGTYRSLFQSVAGTLVKKGLLREDPYDYEVTRREIVVPPDSAIPDSADDAEVSRRIAAFRHELDFLVDGMPFTLASMDPVHLKQVSALLSYIDWEGFGESSRSPTTRQLARLVTKVRLSVDGLSSRVLHESQTQIERYFMDIRGAITELEAWNRESWKAEVRAKVLPRVPSQSPATVAERTAKLLQMKKCFEEVAPKGAWHPALAREILDEDQAPGSAERREKLLVSLAIPGQAPANEETALQRRTKLVEAIRSVCKAAPEIGYCEAVLVENEHALDYHSLGFFQRLKRWFQKSIGRLDDRFYDVEYRPSPGAEMKRERVDFLRLVSEMKEMKEVLDEIEATGSHGYQRIESMEQAQLCDFLEWELRHVRQLHLRMEGLNAHFQSRAVHERGITARSIRLELLAIENCMIQPEAVRREYITVPDLAHSQEKDHPGETPK